jgi:hypothetical protein
MIAYYYEEKWVTIVTDDEDEKETE